MPHCPGVQPHAVAPGLHPSGFHRRRGGRGAGGVFAAAVRSRRVLDAGHEKAWLIRATLHRAGDIRRRAEKRNVPLEAAASSAAPAEDGDLLRAVQALPEKYSAVIHLHYYEGYSIREIGKLLGLPAATVGTRLARGRDRLRKLLKEEIE